MDRIDEAQAAMSEFLGFTNPDDGEKLGMKRLKKLAEQVPAFISQHKELFGEPNSRCLARLKEIAQEIEDEHAWYFAGKIITCLQLHNIASSVGGDASGYWRRELADF